MQSRCICLLPLIPSFGLIVSREEIRRNDLFPRITYRRLSVGKKRYCLHMCTRIAYIFLTAEIMAAAAEYRTKSSSLTKAIHGTLAGVRAAIDQGADVNGSVNNNNKTTPLALAMRIGAPGVPELLLEHGADANLRDPESKKTPLRLAIGLKSPPNVFRVLLEYGADANATADGGDPILHVALSHGVTDTVLDLLLSAGADVNARDKAGRTALHCAVAYSQNIRTVHILESYWASRTILVRDYNGRTPLDSRLRSSAGDSLVKDLQRMRAEQLLAARACYKRLEAHETQIGAVIIDNCHDFGWVLVSDLWCSRLLRRVWDSSDVAWIQVVECRNDGSGGGVSMKFQDERLVLEFYGSGGGSAVVVRYIDLCRPDLEDEIARLRDKYTCDVPGV